MITNEELEQKLEQSPAPRVTKEYIDSRIIEVSFARIGETLTHCLLTIDNGFIVSGESACVNAVNYNKEIGEKIAYDNAFNKLWPLFGFLLAEERCAEKGISTGNYTLSQGYGGDDKVWITRNNPGDGGDFDKESLDRHIQNFFDCNF